MRIQVSYDELYSQAECLQNLNEEYASLCASIQQKMQEAASVWQGEDSKNFLAQAQALYPKLEMMKNTLDSYSAAAKTSAAAYKSLLENRAQSALNLG